MKTANRFDTERKDTDMKMKAMEERLWEEIKQSRQAGTSSSTAATISREADWRPKKITIKGWVHVWEHSFETGVVPAEVEKWLAELRKVQAIRNSGWVDWGEVETIATTV